ncbi:MAG: hypothetical protein ACRD03_15585 [Acidimicrobiales bacterium]
MRDAGLDIHTVVGDMAYSDPDVRVAVERAGASGDNRARSRRVRTAVSLRRQRPA